MAVYSILIWKKYVKTYPEYCWYSPKKIPDAFSEDFESSQSELEEIRTWLILEGLPSDLESPKFRP